MGQFTENSGVKQIPLGSTKVSDVKELFFGDSFFGMSCQENHEKYDRSYKSLKWVNVNLPEMKELSQ
jgi:hypothetical protein